eukprot:Trichotokara_eunicae@DN2661_c0_g1_i2.p1
MPLTFAPEFDEAGLPVLGEGSSVIARMRCVAEAPIGLMTEGDLYVTDGNLLWKRKETSSKGVENFAIDYPSVLLHAVSGEKRTNSASQNEKEKCLYIQLRCDPKASNFLSHHDVPTRDPSEGSSDDESGPENDNDYVEIRLFGGDEEVDQIFKAMCDASSLHPDPEISSDDEDEDGRMNIFANQFFSNPPVKMNGEVEDDPMVESAEGEENEDDDSNNNQLEGENK